MNWGCWVDVTEGKALGGGEKSQYMYNIDMLVQERCNSIANALELRLSCTNSSNCVLQIDRLVQERCNSSALAIESFLH